jgi:hypothetical protein
MLLVEEVGVVRRLTKVEVLLGDVYVLLPP